MNLNELYAKLLREGRGASIHTSGVSTDCCVAHSALRQTGHRVSKCCFGRGPAQGAPKPKSPLLTEEQTGVVLRHLEGRTLRPIVSLLLGTGCEPGGACLYGGAISIGKSHTSGLSARSNRPRRAGCGFKSPKTNGQHNIAIAPSLLAELRAGRLRQQEQQDGPWGKGRGRTCSCSRVGTA